MKLIKNALRSILTSPQPKDISVIPPVSRSFFPLVAAASVTVLLLSGCTSSDNASAPSDTVAQQPASPEEATAMDEQQAPDASPAEQTNDPITLERIPDALLAGQTKQVYAQFTPEFQQDITEQQLAATTKQVLQNIKAFIPLGQPQEMNGNTIHQWLSDTGKIGLIAAVNDNGRISGMTVKAVETFPDTDNKLTRTTYHLPFDGDWFVFWGGNTVMQNYHYEVPEQRYAYDFIQMKDGASYSGDLKLNKSYYAFGKPALAPADGKVVSVVNDIPDNEPVGKMNPDQPAGNMVVIQHGDEYSTLAHLEKGSVIVKKGDMVKQGQKVGNVGNSGNSSEAHMHFQVSDHADLFQGRAIAIRWQDGMKPLKGETVHNNP